MNTQKLISELTNPENPENLEKLQDKIIEHITDYGFQHKIDFLIDEDNGYIISVKCYVDYVAYVSINWPKIEGNTEDEAFVIEVPDSFWEEIAKEINFRYFEPSPFELFN